MSINFMTLPDGDEIYLRAITHVEALTVLDGESFYKVYFNGGQHETIREANKTRVSFITEWKAANP